MHFIIEENIEAYAERYTSGKHSLLEALAKTTWEQTALPQMISNHCSGRLLTSLCQLMQARYALEIGTFTGYSALCIAEGLVPNGKLITCDIDNECEKIARSYFDQSPYGNKIESLVQDGLKTIAEVDHPLDFVFIDADKTNYRYYYEAVLPKLRQGGVIVVDNCLWSGKVLHPKDSESIAIHEFNAFVVNDKRVQNVILTVRDGMNLIIKI